MSTTAQNHGTANPNQRPSRRGGGVGRAIAVVVGSLLVVAGVVAALQAATREVTVTEETFAAGEVGALEVQGQAGDIEVFTQDRSDILVASRVTDSFFGAPDVSAGIAGDTLELESSCAGWFNFGCSVAWTITVPSDFDGPVAVDTTAGDVTLAGLRGTVAVDTTAGEIELDSFQGEIAGLDTTAGDVTVDAITAPTELNINTTAGGVDVTVPDEVYRVEADTTAGDTELQIRQDPAAERVINASTTAGDISISSR